MLGVLVGWYLRRWWERRNTPPPATPAKPVELPAPDGIYHGQVTMSCAVAGPLRRECKISEPLDDTMKRVILDNGPPIEPRSDWVVTFKNKEDGGATVRFSGQHSARDILAESDVGDEFRLELHRTRKREPRVRPAPWEGTSNNQPFGTPFGGGGMS